MGTKMKGLLKGLKQLSNRFEEKDEMQIGLPTDVKHVAHIGWDGPSLESPSWMQHYQRGGAAAQSAPMGFSGLPVENSEKKWVSQDSSRKKSIKASARDLPELPKSSRRQSADSSATSPSPIRDRSKSRSSRRHLRKESDGSKGSRRTKELSTDATDQTDIPKKTRRKKSKDSSVHRSSKSKDKDKELPVNGVSVDSLPPTSFSDPFSEPGSNNIDSVTRSAGNEVLPAASKFKPFVPEMEKASVAVVA